MPKVCFVICAIGDDRSKIRDRADKVLRHVIRPAGEACGYHVIRSDEESQPNQITVDIVKHLRNDPMVIADLTHANPNVYYELGVRHCFSMPAVQIQAKNEPLPFDLGSQKTIPLDIADPDSVEKCKELLIAQIKYAVDNPEKITTPVSVAVALEAYQASGDPSAQLTQVLLEKLESIESKVSALREDRDTRVRDSLIMGQDPPNIRMADIDRYRDALRMPEVSGADIVRSLQGLSTRMSVPEQATQKDEDATE